MRISDWSSDVCSSDLPELATVAATRIGASNDGARLVVVDLAGGRLSKLADDAKPQVDAATSHGTLRNPVAYRNAATGGWRMSFELESGGPRVSELRARLVDAQGPDRKRTRLKPS